MGERSDVAPPNRLCYRTYRTYRYIPGVEFRPDRRRGLRIGGLLAGDCVHESLAATRRWASGQTSPPLTGSATAPTATSLTASFGEVDVVFGGLAVYWLVDCVHESLAATRRWASGQASPPLTGSATAPTAPTATSLELSFVQIDAVVGELAGYWLATATRFGRS
jgi:hypothetical protein